MSRDAAPPAPSRVRVVRPQFYRSELTGRLAPDVRDLLVALTTLADDEGWLVWRPGELGAAIYPYTPAARRVRDLERRAAILQAAELLVLHGCGCGWLPTLREHHGIKGGAKSSAVWGWHSRHSVGIRTDTDGSVSVSASLSGSDSVEGSASSREGEDGRKAVCPDCHRPTSIHADGCPIARNPQLALVAR